MSVDREPLEPEFGQEVSEIEAALGSLAPARGRLDRDLVMFRAGQASGRSNAPAHRAWIAACLALSVVVGGQGLLLARRPSPVRPEPSIIARQPSTPKSTVPPVAIAQVAEARPPGRPEGPTSGPGPGSHDRLAWQVLRYGLDGLPTPGLTSARADRPTDPAPSRRALREELRNVLDPGDPS